MVNWQTYSFSDFVEINPSVALQKGQAFPFIEMKDLNEQYRYVYPSAFRTVNGGARFCEGDILFARITPCLENGKICQAKGLEGGSGFGSTEFLVFRGKPNISNSDFIYYLCRADIVRRYAELHMVGTSGRQRVSKDVFDNLILELPPHPLQHRIAEILGALDDKIELNRQMNHTLEQMAQTLYKHYFVVDIDPDNLPEGWRVGKLGEAVNIRGGGTPSTVEPSFWNGNIHWTSPKDLANITSPFLTETEKKLTPSGLKKVSSGLLPIRTVLLSSRAPIGYIAIADIPVAINQGYIAVLPDSLFSEYFMYFWLKNNIDLIVQYANGSTFMEISKKAFREIESIIPATQSIQIFNETVKYYFDLIKNSTYETEQLIKTRDTLLPKLISGEIIPADLQTLEQSL